MKHRFIGFFVFICVQMGISQVEVQKFNEHFLEVVKTKNLLEADYSDYEVTSQHVSKRSNVHHTYLVQRYQGIPIFNAVMGLHITKTGKLATYDNQFLNDINNRINTTQAKITALQAIEAVAIEMKYNFNPVPKLLSVSEGSTRQHLYEAASLSKEDIPVKLVYQPLPDGKIHLAWELSILEIEGNDWWNIRVDAESGLILDKNNWTVSCTFNNNHQNHSQEECMRFKKVVAEESAEALNAQQYNVYPLGIESPNHGARQVVVAPQDLLASPFGWHDTNGIPGAEFTTTKGNNVEAKDDIAGDNETTIGQYAQGGTNLIFNFPINFATPPSNNLSAALSNLFYWNNIMHDVWYQYGFDEVSGNFQQTNYSGQGVGNDFVRADGLDGSGTNNANFSTPADGSIPRMQMFLWTAGGSQSFTVSLPVAVAGNYSVAKAAFGASSYNLTGQLALYSPILACSTATNASSLVGKIAVVDRGTCQFSTKCLNAQNAGAIAVIVCNNVSGSPFSMSGGTDAPSVTIPCIMMSQANCNTIKLQIPNTVVANMSATSGTQLDGDFDNGIIAHEYGHGISNRLTGGSTNVNCLSNQEQMGEGWSDWFGLMLTMNASDQGTTGKGIGTYALNQPITGTGIRQYKYSTSMTTNPHTYDAIKTVAVPHGVGSVWCAMLWEMTWLLIDTYGFDPDYYNGTGGNNIAMALVIEALKLQPCSPGFVSGRDAILVADDVLYNGIHKCLIWKAFAKRGLGFSANQGATTSRSDGTEAFNLPTQCCKEVYIKDNSGTGSLRDAINCAADGDTIKFAPFLDNKTITLVNGLVVNKSLNIVSETSNGVKLITTNAFPTLTIANQNVTLQNLTLIGGSDVSARALVNNGNLICNDIKIVDPLIPSNTGQSVINNGTMLFNGVNSLKKE